jgi:hypothetical protein
VVIGRVDLTLDDPLHQRLKVFLHVRLSGLSVSVLATKAPMVGAGILES